MAWNQRPKHSSEPLPDTQGPFSVHSISEQLHLPLSAQPASIEALADLDRGDAGSAVIGQTTVTVTGKLATLGGRMIDSVADRLLDQFYNLIFQCRASAGWPQCNLPYGNGVRTARLDRCPETSAPYGWMAGWTIRRANS